MTYRLFDANEPLSFVDFVFLQDALDEASSRLSPERVLGYDGSRILVWSSEEDAADFDDHTAQIQIWEVES